MDNSSSFFETPSEMVPELMSAPELIHSSDTGFCELYRINREGRFRVLKCLKPEYRGKDLYEKLLRKEFEMGYSQDHPNICEYYAFRHAEGLGNCIEMEWVDGRTLSSVLQDGKVDGDLAGKLADELCDALSYIHSKQIVHKDLKPSNILVTYKSNTVKLIDFGFSDSDAHAFLNVSAGTAAFAAPEVLNGSRADVRSDIYSLGLILSQLSRRYRPVARKCCEKQPWRRYGSVREVHNAIYTMTAASFREIPPSLSLSYSSTRNCLKTGSGMGIWPFSA